MAKKAKDVAHRGISPEEFKSFIATRARMASAVDSTKTKLDEYVKNIIKKHFLDKLALTWALKLAKLKPERQQATLRSFIEYCHKLGLFAQMDAFDDLTDILQGIVDDARQRKHNGPADEGAFDGVDGEDDDNVVPLK